jgi:hypothetical protein
MSKSFEKMEEYSKEYSNILKKFRKEEISKEEKEKEWKTQLDNMDLKFLEQYIRNVKLNNIKKK